MGSFDQSHLRTCEPEFDTFGALVCNQWLHQNSVRSGKPKKCPNDGVGNPDRFGSV